LDICPRDGKEKDRWDGQGRSRVIREDLDGVRETEGKIEGIPVSHFAERGL
jgi:hypothetical protein